MSKNERIAVALFLIATVGAIGAIFAYEGYRRSSRFTAVLVARAPEHGSWYPNIARLPVGREVRLLIRNIDTVTHGFAVPDLGVAIPEIKAGQAREVTLVADRKGRFPFMCSVWCSTRHLEMRGEIVVE